MSVGACQGKLSKRALRILVHSKDQSAAGVWRASIGARTWLGVLSSTIALMNISGNQNSIGMTLSLQSVQAAQPGQWNGTAEVIFRCQSFKRRAEGERQDAQPSHAPVLIRHSHVIDCSRKRNALFGKWALILACTAHDLPAKAAGFLRAANQKRKMS